MKMQRYIEILNNDMDFEGGLLSDLIEDTPKELHLNIMSLLTENSKKRRISIPKKYYTSAAAVIIIVVLVFGLKGFINSMTPKKATMDKKLITSNTAMKEASEKSEERGIKDKINEEAQALNSYSSREYSGFLISTEDMEIVNYIKDNGEKVGNGVYIVSNKYYEEFTNLLGKKGTKLIKIEDDNLPLENIKSKFNLDECFIIKINK